MSPYATLTFLLLVIQANAEQWSTGVLLALAQHQLALN